MRAPCRCFAVLALLTLLPSVPALAAGPKTIGTATFVGRPDLTNLPIVDFQWAVHNGPTMLGSGGGSSKAAADPFRITKLLDAASPALLDLTVRGVHIEQVRIDVTLRRGTTATYLLSTVVASADERRLTGGTALQDIGLTATTIEEIVVSPGGTVSTCFNFGTSSACP
jgi:hypothetical protein